jgi:hypothetical protein
MQNKFSFTCETMADAFITSGHFMFTESTGKISVVQHKNTGSSESSVARKWWKFW